MNSSSDPPSPPEMPSSPSSKPAPALGRFRFSKVCSRWWWLATLLVVAVTYTIAMIPEWMGMRGPLYESTALIQVNPTVDAGIGLPTNSSTGSSGPIMTRQFINTQFEIISMPTTLERALDKKDLLRRLGGDKHAAINRMQKSIRTNLRRGTDLIEISYRDEDAKLAHDGAEAVYQAYKDRCYDFEMSRRKDQLKAIKAELEKRNDRVSELRKRLMDIAEKVGLVWEGTDDTGKSGIKGLHFVLRRTAMEKELYDLERKQEQLIVELSKLTSIEDDELYLLLLDQPDAEFKAVYEKYETARSEVETMKASGLAGNHPKAIASQKRVSELKQDMKKRALKHRESVRHQLKLVKQRVEKMRKLSDKYYDRGTAKAREIQEFNIARKEYQTALELKDQMEEKYDIEKTKLVFPLNSIILHDAPRRGTKPVTRGHDFYMGLGTIISLPFSIGLGILLMYIAEMIFPRKV